jgi:hypothetical protein
VYGTLVDPMDFAENAQILNAMNDEKRSIYESRIKNVTEMAFRAQCRPVRITYFKAGDACIQKGLQITKNEMDEESEHNTSLIMAGGYTEPLTPPFLNGNPIVNFCLSETIENVYRRGYSNVVMYDFSCSALTLRNTAGRAWGEAHGGPVSVALQRSGLAGGAGAR